MTSPSDGFLTVEFEMDPDQLVQDMLAYLSDNIPGWEPQDGQPEVWLAQAIARMTVEAAAVASQVPPAIFSYFGSTLMGIPQNQGVAATMQSTWTAVDTAGYTIPSGTAVAYRIAGDSLLVFRTTADVSISAGSSATAPGGVGLIAVDAGTTMNGIPSGTSLELIDALNFVSSVVTTSDSAGGVDAESDDAYLDRLHTTLQLLSPAPILPNDFAVLAATISGVARALGISGYDPDANYLTPNQASADTDSSGWAAGANTTLARTLAWSAENGIGWALTATGAGDISMNTPTGTSGFAVVAGTVYDVTAIVRAAATSRTASISVTWYNSGGSVISTVAGPSSADSSSVDTVLGPTALAAAPAGSAFASVQVKFASAAGSEVHYVDQIGFLPHGVTWNKNLRGATTNPRYVTVALVDSNGAAVSGSIKTAVVAYLNSLREVNFIVKTTDPTYTTINVVFSVKVLDGFDPTDVVSRASAAVAEFLSPANFAGGDATPPTWRSSENKIRYLQTSAVIQAVSGVQYVASLTLNGGVVDITMTGIAPLPQAGTISGSAI